MLTFIRSGRVSLAWSGVLVAGLLGYSVDPALATFIRDPVTLDRTSPSVVAGTVGPSDILGTVSNPGSGAPLVHIAATNYGVGEGNNALDISNGEELPDAEQFLFFTVDRASTGIAGSVLRSQTDFAVASASDQFKSRLSITPAAALANGTVATATAHTLDLDQTFYNLQADDNADSLELIQFKPAELTADRNRPVYFTLDAASPALSAEGYTSSDVLLSEADGNQVFGLFADASTLGLLDGDVIDGLAVWDADGVVDTENGADLALFSLAPGSPSLGLLDPLNPFSPADVFITNFGGAFSLYVDHTDLGLNLGDNIDGLDVQAVPEPTTLAVLMVPAIALLGRRRRAI